MDNTLFFTKNSFTFPHLHRSTDDGVTWLVGIKEPADGSRELAVFPNPADQSVVIGHESLENKNYTLKICDITGMEVFQSSALRLPSSMDVRNFDNGIHFVQLSTKIKQQNKS